MKECFIAIDLGATSGRTILGSFTPDGLELEEINRFPNHIIETTGHCYWDIYELYRRILEGLKLLAQRSDVEIASIGIDTWGVDFVCIGKDGQILRIPYSYRDPHTKDAPNIFFSRVSRSHVYELTGIQVMNFNSLFQLDTMRRNADIVLTNTDKILFISDTLSYLLTGQMVTEYTIASTAQLMNASTFRFDPELLQALGLTEKYFARLVYPGEKVGELSTSVQRITGLGPVPVIAVAGHDTASAVAAVPACNRNFAYLSSGTWSLMGIETDTPIITPESEALNFTNEGGVNGTIRFLKNICGMWLLERCRQQWQDVSYENLIIAAKSSDAFRSLIDPDDPFFSNPEDMQHAIQEYCLLTKQNIPVTQGQIVRCIFESLALRYRQVFESLRSFSSHSIDVLHVIGGGSRNDLLNQWTCDSIGIPVVAGPSEATAIGNIMLQVIQANPSMDLYTIRKLLSASLPLKNYQPRDKESWDNAYWRFTELTRRNKKINNY